MLRLLLLVFLVGSGHGQQTSFMQQQFPTTMTTCPLSPSNTTVTILGTGNVNYISESWKYLIEESQECDPEHYTVTIQDILTSTGTPISIIEEEDLAILSQICRDPTFADIAATLTEFVDFDILTSMNVVTRPDGASNGDDGGGSSSDDYTLECTESDMELFQINIAYDAIALAIIKGTATQDCIESLPGAGLTLDQIRWMFSSYTLEELEATGWDAMSVPLASDYGNERSWAALGGVLCFPSLIDVAGVTPPDVDDMDDKNQFFRMAILKDWHNGETFRSDYIHTPFYNTQDFLTDNPDGIAFYWYQDGGGAAHSPRPDAVTRVTDGFVSVSIQNDGTLEFFAPSRETITTNVRVASGASKPLYPSALVRQYQWNIAINGNSSEIVAKVGPLLNVGFSIDGDAALRNDDFLPLSVLEKSIMSARLIVGSGLGSSNSRRSVNCGDSELAGGSLVVAGSTAVHALAKLWAGVFETLCAKDAILVNVIDAVIAEGSAGSIDDTSSSVSARLVCGQNEEPTVDIGTMERDWVVPNEATSSNQNGQFECADSDKQVLQVGVATQALSVVTSLQGTAFDCLQHLGGLTLEELRWIFSSLSEQELINDGVEGVPSNSDGNNATHLWSELDFVNQNGTMICQNEEILLAGPEVMSFEYNFMSRLLFNQGLGEAIDTSRETSDYSYFSSSVPQYIVDYLVSNGNAIAFLPYGIATEYKNLLAITPLSEKVNVTNGPNPPKILPDSISMEEGRYPLAQTLFMNLNMNEVSLAYSLPYMEFGLSPYGQRLAEMAGHVPLSNQTLREMENRLSLLKNLSIALPATEPPTLSPATPGGQDTTQPTPETGGDTSQPMLSSAPTAQPISPATMPPTTNPPDGQSATMQPTTTETPVNETTSEVTDSNTRDSGSSSSSDGDLKHSRLFLSRMLGIVPVLLLFS